MNVFINVECYMFLYYTNEVVNVYLYKNNFRSRRLTTTLMTWMKTLSPSDALVKNAIKTHFNKEIEFICILLSMSGKYENGWIWKVF